MKLDDGNSETTSESKSETTSGSASVESASDATDISDLNNYQNKMLVKYVELMSKLEEINQLPKIRSNFKMLKDQIKTLHNSNMNFVIDIEEKKIAQWLSKQCKALWNQIVIRYRATLTNGENFVNFANASPAVLCRGVSAAVSSSLSNTGPVISRQATNSSGICKICYVNPINMIFKECQHSGTCTECVQKHIDLNNMTISDYKCPFCTTSITSFISIESTNCQSCHSTARYFGECTHPISCKKCISSAKMHYQKR